MDKVTGLAEHPGTNGEVVGHRLDQVEAATSRERRAGAPDEGDADVRVTVDSAHMLARLMRIGADGVEPRSVEGDPQHAIGRLVEAQGGEVAVVLHQSASLPNHRHAAEGRSVREWSARLFDDIHEEFRAPSARSSSGRRCPHHERWEADGIVDRELFPIAGANGFLGMEVPEELRRRRGPDFRFNVVIAEEIQRADVNAAGLGITLHNDICLPYFLHLTNDEQKRAVAARASAPAS